LVLATLAAALLLPTLVLLVTILVHKCFASCA
jgi:hypothetical protein